MKSIDLEDIATVFLTEAIKANPYLFERLPYENGRHWQSAWSKMNYAARKKFVAKVLDKLMESNT